MGRAARGRNPFSSSLPKNVRPLSPQNATDAVLHATEGGTLFQSEQLDSIFILSSLMVNKVQLQLEGGKKR